MAELTNQKHDNVSDHYYPEDCPSVWPGIKLKTL